MDYLQVMLELLRDLKILHPEFRHCFRRYHKLDAQGLFPVRDCEGPDLGPIISLQSRCSEAYLQITITRSSLGVFAWTVYKNVYEPEHSVWFQFERSNADLRGVCCHAEPKH